MNLALYQLAQAAEELAPRRWWSIVIAVLFAIIFHLIFFIRWQNDAVTEGAEDIGKDGIVVGIQRITQIAPPAKPPTPQPAPVQPTPPTTIAAPAIQPLARAVNESSIAIPKEVSKEPAKEIAPEEPAKEPLQEKIEEPVAKEKPEPKTTAATSDTATTTDVDNDLQPAPEMVAGGGDPAADIQYVRRLTAWLERNKRYPTKSRRRREEGTVLLNFTIDREGRLIDYQLIQKAPYPTLNASVEQMIKRASPLPPPPSTMQAEAQTISFTVPINFSLNRR